MTEAPRKVAILVHDRFGPFTSKTAMALIRYGSDEMVAVVDRSKAQSDAGDHIGQLGEGIPVVSSTKDAVPMAPDVMV